MFSALLLTVIGSGLALSKIERLQDRAPGIAELPWEHPHAVGDRYFTQTELLSSLHEKQVRNKSPECKGIVHFLQGQRDRRQSSSQPQQSGKFEFLDGYHYGLIHYSGSESEVRTITRLPMRPKPSFFLTRTTGDICADFQYG
jgi:hypothetical protein